MSWLFEVMYKISRVIPGFNKFMGMIYSCDIPRKAHIGKNVRLFHNALGVVINKNAVIGDNVTIYHHVTIGNNKVSGEAPTIGDNVTLGSYAMVLGKISIGENTVIGAGSIVMHDVPANCTYYNKREEVCIGLDDKNRQTAALKQK